MKLASSCIEKLAEIDLHFHDLRHYAEPVIMPRGMPEAPVRAADLAIERDRYAA